MFNHKAAVQAVDYILKNSSPISVLDKLTILKLLFFAERYSLRKYAQSITNDQFRAMRCGPVASATYDIIGFKGTVALQHEAYAQEILSQEGTYSVKSKNALITREDYDELSDTDIEALDFSIKEFGKYSSSKLIDITHKYTEWSRFEKELSQKDSSHKMLSEDFFAKTNDDTNQYSIIPDANVELSKTFYLENDFAR